MSTTSESGQHLVVLVAAGDGSDAACEAVARKLAEKFGAPFERMLASVRRSPRVFKRDLNLAQAESYAALLRSMGAVVEVQVNGSKGKPEPAPSPAEVPKAQEAATPVKPSPAEVPEAQEAATPVKPPPPEATDRSCPFCGRALQADGICVICKPREVGPESSPGIEESSPSVAPEPETASLAQEPETIPLKQEPEPAPLAQESEPVMDPVAGLETNFGFQDIEPPAAVETVPADGGWAAPANSEEIGRLVSDAGPDAAANPGCANCGGTLTSDGQCPACDLGAVADTAGDDSASIENDLSTLLSPEELGVCPNCCGPMEQDGTCLICPPAEPTSAPELTPPASFGEQPMEDPDNIQVPPPVETPGPATPEPGGVEERSPFDPLASLGVGPTDGSSDICRGCGGPKGDDGLCLICGEGDTDGADAPGSGSVPEVEEMTLTGNEPPPAEPAPAEAEEAVQADPTVEPQEKSALAAKTREEAQPSGKKPGINLDLTKRPRALTIPLLASVILLVGGISMAMTGSFVIASGIFFVALIAGLVTAFKAIGHFERTMAGFPKLPKPVIIAFLAFLFFAGSGSIVGYAFKQSALFLLDKASEQLQAEAGHLPGEGGDLREAGGVANVRELSAAEAGGQIILEDEMLERAITAESEGEDNPKAALENWRAYLEGFPDGSRASEAKRKVSHWRSVVKREDALAAVLTRDRKGNNDPTIRIREWKSCLSTYGNTPALRTLAEERIAFWESMLQQSSTPNFPYWASLRLDDGRIFSGKVVAENDRELKMELPNRLKMKFSKGEYEVIDSDHINGKRVECENMQLVSGVTTERPTWGHEDGITILGEDRAGVEAMVPFRVTGFYHFEVMARASKDHSGFPSVILSLNGTQQERIRFDSEEWKLYKVSFPFRIPAGEQRLEIVFPPQYQTMQDKRIVAIDYFTTAMVE